MKIFLFVLMATIFEAAGDAIVRIALHQSSLTARIGFFLVGACLLAAYGTSLNLAPVEFGTVVGLYIALLFLMFQVTNYVAFRTLPTVPVMIGGVLIVSGGTLIYAWR